MREVRRGGRLIRYADGHAEVENAPSQIIGRHGTIESRGVFGYLTKRSVQLFDSHHEATERREDE